MLAGALADKATAKVLADLRSRFLPNKVLALAGDSSQGSQPPEELADLLIGKSMQGGVPTLFVCEGHTCQAPAQGEDEIIHALEELMPHGLFD